MSGREIGASVKLTEHEMFEIEELATNNGRQRKWGKPGKPYRFSFRTITCYDRSDNEVKEDRRCRSNKRTNARRKSERLAMAMQSTTLTQPTKVIYAGVKDAITANVRAQEKTLFEAIGPEGSTIAELMAKVSSDPSWRSLAASRDSFRRTVSGRLNTLKAAGQVVDEYRLGPHGMTRIVRRADSISGKPGTRRPG